jgi:hypothetical protein
MKYKREAVLSSGNDNYNSDGRFTCSLFDFVAVFDELIHRVVTTRDRRPQSA